jgi:hypothetical protein
MIVINMPGGAIQNIDESEMRGKIKWFPSGNTLISQIITFPMSIMCPHITRQRRLVS